MLLWQMSLHQPPALRILSGGEGFVSGYLPPRRSGDRRGERVRPSTLGPNRRIEQLCRTSSPEQTLGVTGRLRRQPGRHMVGRGGHGYGFCLEVADSGFGGRLRR